MKKENENYAKKKKNVATSPKSYMLNWRSGQNCENKSEIKQEFPILVLYWGHLTPAVTLALSSPL